MPFDHCRRFEEYQGIQDPRPHSVKAHPQEPIGGMKTEAARALPPQDDQLMSQDDSSSSSDDSAAKLEREHGNESRQNGDHAAQPYGDHTGKSPSFPDSSQF
jgi:hypothetical protein